jgi:hypothetical protein
MMKKASTKPPAKKQKSVSKYYCTEHGQNPTHSTADYWTIKKRVLIPSYNSKGEEDHFQSKSQKWDRFVFKQLSKKKISEMYASVIRREQAKLEEERPQKRKKIIAPDPDSKSDDKMSAQIISVPKKKVVKTLSKRFSDNSDVLTEEQEYQ